MIEILRRKAQGFEVTETTKEYVMDEEGNARLCKEKVSIKYIPPDLSAIKACMELSDSELYAMSDAELKKEKKRLLTELAGENTVGKKTKESNEKKDN